MRLLCVLFWLMFSVVDAQDILKAPHGGRMKTVDGVKVEVLGCNDYLEVYLYDSGLDPINNSGVEGSVKFIFQDGQTNLSTSLVRYGMDGFTAKISLPTFTYMQITFNLFDKIIKVKFDNVCTAISN